MLSLVHPRILLSVNRMRILLCLVGVLVSGCASFPEPRPQPPIPAIGPASLPGPPAAFELISEGVLWSSVPIPGAAPGAAAKLWVYTPTTAVPEGGRPVVLIAPAGSSLVVGNAMGSAATPEHIPYVREGYIVVAFELSGRGDEDSHVKQFGNSNGGLDDARLALRYVLEVLPDTDPRRVYAVGHSSAGDIAMLLASHEDALAGAVVYNSSGEGCWYQRTALLAEIQSRVPELERYCQRGRAANHLHHLRVPLLMFASAGDHVVSAWNVRKTVSDNPAAPIELRVLSSGGHYNSMIQDEIPAALKWMAERTRTK